MRPDARLLTIALLMIVPSGSVVSVPELLRVPPLSIPVPPEFDTVMVAPRLLVTVRANSMPVPPELSTVIEPKLSNMGTLPPVERPVPAVLKISMVPPISLVKTPLPPFTTPVLLAPVF